MKTIDFSKLGGFPLCQDDIEYLQTGYIEVLQALARMGLDGSTPYRISGMVVSGGGNTVSDGWFYYGGEIIKFTGSTVIPGGTDVALVTITATASSLVFDDASTPNVILDTVAGLTTGPTLTDATHFPVSALQAFGVGFGKANRAAWDSYTVSVPAGSGGVTGTLYYKKDHLNNALMLKGVLTANNAFNLPLQSTGSYVNVAFLPAALWPAADVYFYANVPYGLSDQEDGGTAFLSIFPGVVGVAGNIAIRMVKSTYGGVYPVYINCSIPLD